MRRHLITPLLLAALAATPAPAQNPASDTGWARATQDRTVMTSEGFLGAHPDIKYRLQGLDWHGKGNWQRALEDFRQAARYADKPAQGMLGEMYWNGQGVDVDRATAYAWMDIAAERGYPFLIVKREKFWNAMDAAERERAVEIGTALYTDYGDPAAKPRLERLLTKAKRDMTGSRVGSVGFLTIMIPTPGGMRPVDGSQYWNEKFWNPELYWRWQDHDWKKPAQGEVTVGTVLTDENEPGSD